MAKLEVGHDSWYCYFPVLECPDYPEFGWDYRLEVTEDEERWVWETYKEWQEVQKFIASKLDTGGEKSNGK